MAWKLTFKKLPRVYIVQHVETTFRYCINLRFDNFQNIFKRYFICVKIIIWNIYVFSFYLRSIYFIRFFFKIFICMLFLESAESCQDQIATCSEMQDLCTSREYALWTKTYCPRYCGLCDGKVF